MDPTGGVIDHGDQLASWTAILQPAERRAVLHHQLPKLALLSRHTWIFFTRWLRGCQKAALLIHVRRVSRLTRKPSLAKCSAANRATAASTAIGHCTRRRASTTGSASTSTIPTA